MASIEEFIGKLELLIDTLPEITLDGMEIAALGALALVQQRVQEQGVDANGTPWRPYTAEYKRFKEKAGKTGNGKVNFTFSGRMWNNTGIVSQGINGSIVSVVVKPRARENQDKMEGLSYGKPSGIVPDYNRKGKDGKTVRVSSYFSKGTQGRGKIMEMSSKEEEIITRSFKNSIVNQVSDILK